jgi:hypothetical protein
MLGRKDMKCMPISIDQEVRKLYERDIFEDMKSAIDLLNDFNIKLNKLHPDIIYKIKSLI